MKKILLILLGMVSIFSLTSCSTRETISDEEAEEIKSKFARQDYKTIVGDYSFLVDVRMTATIGEDRNTYNESTKQNTSLIIDGNDSSDLYSFTSSFSASEDNQTFAEEYAVMISEMTKKPNTTDSEDETVYVENTIYNVDNNLYEDTPIEHQANSASNIVNDDLKESVESYYFSTYMAQGAQIYDNIEYGKDGENLVVYASLAEDALDSFIPGIGMYFDLEFVVVGDIVIKFNTFGYVTNMEMDINASLSTNNTQEVELNGSIDMKATLNVAYDDTISHNSRIDSTITNMEKEYGAFNKMF